MLVLSRKRDESICVGNDIRVTVVDLRGDKVRLGIEAPKEVPVHRREVYDAICGVSPTDTVSPGLPVVSEEPGRVTPITVTTWPGPNGLPVLVFESNKDRPYRVRLPALNREELTFLRAAIDAALERQAA